jgi:hypothetical protein
MVNSGNNPDKNSYKFTGKFNDDANICTTSTTCGRKLKIAPITPANKISVMTEVHKKVTLKLAIVFASIFWLLGDNWRGISCFNVKFGCTDW